MNFTSKKNNHPTVTYTLLLVNIGVYTYLAWQSKDLLQIDRSFMEKYGFVREFFFEGAYWQLITNMVAHFDITHLGYNLLFLTIFGAKAEELFGGMRVLLMYLVFGIATTFTAFLYPLGTISAGASGAIFGLLGADLIAQRGMYGQGAWSSFFYGFIFFIFAATTGFLAHLVGLIIGFIVGYIISRDWYSEDMEIEDGSPRNLDV